MFKRITIFFFALLAITTQMNAQNKARLIERMMDAPPLKGTPFITFAKYELPNGLILLIHEDRSDPVVHVDVTYHVGSAREDIGMSGFAHFFEHMMFQGSKNVGDEEHFKIINGAGGTMNGTTNRDRTNYFETVPKNYLETALWLEADRMGFLLEAVTKEKFEIQRATVKNEKGQNYDNRPYGMVSELVAKNLYPYGHPYSWLTIGNVEDLDRVTVDDLKRFFLRWYGPNNAVVTVGGDVNEQEVVALVEKYFGSIPRGPEVEKQQVEPFKLEMDRYVSMEDNVRFPMLRVTYPSVPHFSEDEAALDILAEILGQGKNSIMYQKLVKTQRALQASAMNPASELAGEFAFTILTYPATPLSEAAIMLKEVLAEFEAKGFNDEMLQMARAKKEAQALYGLESVAGKVSQLASYETFTGRPNSLGRDVSRYMQVTRADVMRVYEKYIKGQHALYVSVLPKGKSELKAARSNYVAGKMDTTIVVSEQYANLQPRPAVDNFNRGKRPKAGPAPTVKTPLVQEVLIPMTGKTGALVRNVEMPIMSMQISLKAGQLYQDPAKAGVAYMLSRMLQEDNRMFSGEEMERELAKLGTELRISVGQEDLTVNLRCLVKNIERSIELMAISIAQPAFNQDDFDRLKKEQLEAIANQSTQPTAIASLGFNQLVYGSDHIMGTSIYGTKESVSAMTLDDVKKFYEQTVNPNNAVMAVSGDLTEQDLIHNMVHLGMWAPNPFEEMPLPATEAKMPEKTRIYMIDKPGAPQSEIRVGYLALPYDATGDYFKASFMNYVLGGAFNSRINLNLREDKGWTYGARSYYIGSHIPGPFMVSTGVKADATDSAVVEIMKELRTYVEKGIQKDELEWARSSVLEREALKYETNFQKLGLAMRKLEYNLPDDYLTRQATIIKKIKKKEVNALAKKYVPYDNMYILVVGDAEAFRAKLAQLGYGDVELIVLTDTAAK